MIPFLIILAVFVMTMASIVRWFEQVNDSVDRRDWRRTMLLVLCPPAAWMYPGTVAAGRPIAVPHHEPVRGFGAGPPMPGDAPRPPKPGPKRGQVDVQAIMKLRAKMKQQGMLHDDSDSPA